MNKIYKIDIIDEDYKKSPYYLKSEYIGIIDGKNDIKIISRKDEDNISEAEVCIQIGDSWTNGRGYWDKSINKKYKYKHIELNIEFPDFLDVSDIYEFETKYINNLSTNFDRLDWNKYFNIKCKDLGTTL